MNVPEGKIRLYSQQDISFEEALASERDIVAQSHQYQDTIALKLSLYRNAAALCQLVGAHLGLDGAQIQVDIPQYWRQGSFNLVLPMLVYDRAVDKSVALNPADYPMGLPPTDASVVRRVALRWPNPSRCAGLETLFEKVCCEVASYIWMQRCCPGIRIPQLYGFGLPTGQHFTQAHRLPWYRRIILRIRQTVASILRLPVPSEYHIFQPPRLPLPLPPSIMPCYMILEHLGPEFGKAISETQAAIDDDPRRRNLYRSLSRIMLAIAHTPQPKIGSFSFDPVNGTIALTNRPVTCELVMLENEDAPRVVKPGVLYTSAQAYVDQLLAFQDSCFRSLANSVTSHSDCELQMSVRVLFRAVADHFRHATNTDGGPFYLRLTDVNAANFLIDQDWHITAMYDLEWIVAQPLSMHEVPHWLTGKGIDQCAGKHYDEYSAARADFMEVFREEEAAQSELVAGIENRTPISAAIDASWASGRYWFNSSLLSVNALHNITQYRFRHLFGLDEANTEYWRLWAPDAEAVAQQKVRDRTAYVARLAALFGRDPFVAADGDENRE